MTTDHSIPEDFPPHLLPHRKCVRCARPYDLRLSTGADIKPWSVAILTAVGSDGRKEEHGRPLCFECAQAVPSEEDRRDLVRRHLAAA